MTLGMQPCASTLTGSVGTFVQCFQCLLATPLLVKLWRQHGPKPRGQTPKLSGPELVRSLVFHVLCGVGTLAPAWAYSSPSCGRLCARWPRLGNTPPPFIEAGVWWRSTAVRPA